MVCPKRGRRNRQITYGRSNPPSRRSRSECQIQSPLGRNTSMVLGFYIRKRACRTGMRMLESTTGAGALLRGAAERACRMRSSSLTGVSTMPVTIRCSSSPCQGLMSRSCCWPRPETPGPPSSRRTRCAVWRPAPAARSGSSRPAAPGYTSRDEVQHRLLVGIAGWVAHQRHIRSALVLPHAGLHHDVEIGSSIREGGKQRAQIGGGSAFRLAALHGEIHFRAAAISEHIFEFRAEHAVERRGQDDLDPASAGRRQRRHPLVASSSVLVCEARVVTRNMFSSLMLPTQLSLRMSTLRALSRPSA